MLQIQKAYADQLNNRLDYYECCAASHYEHKWWNRELTPKCTLKCYVKPMKDPLGVSPSKANQRTTRGKEKFRLTSVGIEPTTSGLDLPLLHRLSYEVGQRKVGDDLGGQSRRRETKGRYECCAA